MKKACLHSMVPVDGYAADAGAYAEKIISAFTSSYNSGLLGAEQHRPAKTTQRRNNRHVLVRQVGIVSPMLALARR